MRPPISKEAAVQEFGLSRQQIQDGIESGQINAWVRSRPGAARTHWRMTPESVESYRDMLRGVAR